MYLSTHSIPLIFCLFTPSNIHTSIHLCVHTTAHSTAASLQTYCWFETYRYARKATRKARGRRYTKEVAALLRFDSCGRNGKNRGCQFSSNSYSKGGTRGTNSVEASFSFPFFAASSAFPGPFVTGYIIRKNRVERFRQHGAPSTARILLFWLVTNEEYKLTPVNDPTRYFASISLASSECPTSSKASVASLPASAKRTSSPPGCY